MSISGMRAVVGETLDPSLALKMGKAFGTFIGKGPVIIGGDTRVSYDMVQKAVVSGLVSVGTDVIDVGRVLTPTVQQMIRTFNAKGGIVISASHNPIQWNGIKLMNEAGSFLTPEEYAQFEPLIKEENFPLKSWDAIGTVTEVTDAVQRHVDIILSKIDTTSISASKLRVLVDPNNGAGALADPILLDALGVEYDILNADPNGKFNHDPEPLENNLTELKEALQKGNYDIGFAQDADADRLVILDERGRFIGEDYSLGICVDYILQTESSPSDCVVVNLSTSLVIENIAKQHGLTTHYTKIGETNVTEGIRQHNAIAGGEGNGGVIYPKVGWGRDSLVGIVLALKHLAESKKTVSEIVNSYPKFIMIKDKYSIASRDEVLPFLDKIKAHYASNKIDTQDGVKVYFDNAWVHVRPSNTEPIVRIFVEAPTKDEALRLIDEVKSL
jgi:phosphomannomutase